MTDIDAICYIKELMDYNAAGRMVTPQLDRFDTIFQCALNHAVRALEEKSGVKDLRYVKNPNGTYSVTN